MTVIRPDGVDALGKQTLWIVPSIASAALLQVTLAELTAGKNVSKQVYGFNPNSEQGSAPDVRLGDVEQYESPGRATVSVEEIEYVYDPQAPADATNYFMPGLCIPGATKFVVDRRGLSIATAAAASQFADIYTVTFGAANRVSVDQTADGQKFRMRQKWFVTGLRKLDASIVA